MYKVISVAIGIMESDLYKNRNLKDVSSMPRWWVWGVQTPPEIPKF
jgi:hypothetical protein